MNIRLSQVNIILQHLMAFSVLWVLFPAHTLSYSDKHDPLMKAPEIPSIFWSNGFRRQICSQYDCLQKNNNPYYNDVLDLKMAINSVSELLVAPVIPPEVMVVSGDNFPSDSPIAILSDDIWWNLIIKDQKHEEDHAYFPDNHIRLTPDKIAIRPAYNYRGSRTISLRSSNERVFNDILTWLNLSVDFCQFYRHPRAMAALRLMLTRCDFGKTFESMGVEVNTVLSYLLIHRDSFDTISKEQLIIEVLKALADYYLAIPAIHNPRETIHRAYNFLTTDLVQNRQGGSFTFRKNYVEATYDLQTYDELILWSKDIYAIWQHIENHIQSQDPESRRTFQLFSESASAKKLFARIKSTPAFKDYQKTLKGDSWDVSTDFLSTIWQLRDQLGFDLLFDVQQAIIDYYTQIPGHQIIDAIHFEALEKFDYGLTSLKHRHDRDKVINTISNTLMTFVNLSKSEPTTYFDTVITRLQKYLLALAKITGSHHSPIPHDTTTIFAREEMIQIFTTHRTVKPDKHIDPDVYLILFFLENNMTKNALHYYPEQLKSIKDEFFSNSPIASQFVDHIHSEYLSGKNSFTQLFKSSFPSSHFDDLPLSKNNIFLLVGLLYEVLPHQLLTEIESSLLNYYLEKPFHLMGDKLDLTQFSKENFGLQHRFYFPEFIRLRIVKQLTQLLKPTHNYQRKKNLFLHTMKNLSMLLKLHKTTLAEKWQELTHSSLYLYTFQLRQDEVIQHYLTLANLHEDMYQHYLVSHIENSRMRTRCLQFLASNNILDADFTEFETLTMDYSGSYSPCWRAINVARERARHNIAVPSH
ncbi:MAG: hypothetical protein OXC40_03300 [Proteobacteria bacterium]|nr:hypothetical protein [Pseudomonadota bacterium]